MNKQAELISIGNELLSGQTLNSHARDLGAALAAIGLWLVRDTTIPDDIPTIGAALTEAFARTPLVFISGGLGPTSDDITRDAIAQAFGLNIVLDPPTLAVITERFTTHGRNMTPAAERQALVLDGATVLPNSAGAAPGERLKIPNGKTLFILPGPPNEFNAILNEEVVPWLKKQYADARPDLVRIIQTQGIGESDIVTILEKESFQPMKIDLGFYPGDGKVKITLTTAPENKSEITAAEKQLTTLLSGYIESDLS